jgi:hypothetical protein
VAMGLGPPFWWGGDFHEGVGRGAKGTPNSK